MNSTETLEQHPEQHRIRHAELLHADDRLVVHLAELHSPSDHRWPFCTGCDHHGQPMNAATWPCRTWSLLAEEVDR